MAQTLLRAKSIERAQQRPHQIVHHIRHRKGQEIAFQQRDTIEFVVDQIVERVKLLDKKEGVGQ